ncbi:MAG: hypothetical protein H6711_01550 [Myxococcales bacterium]|nr:hypothetical protein [Myxococcales bacterium]
MRRAPLLLAALIAATLGWRSEARDVEPCTAERLCRSGGVECRFDRGDPAACEEDVKERGLVRVCTRSNANVYCPKDQIKRRPGCAIDADAEGGGAAIMSLALILVVRVSRRRADKRSFGASSGRSCG